MSPPPPTRSARRWQKHKATRLPRSTQSHLPVGHPGRRKIYDPVYAPRARKLALAGFTDGEVAEHFGVDENTLRRWQVDHPEFFTAMHEGRELADAEVVDSLFNRARGMKVPAVKIFMPQGAEKPVYAPYEEFIPPDVGAAKMWLTNRRNRDWRERREVEVSGSLEHRLLAMTPEQRRARLIELHAKATEVIEGATIEPEAEMSAKLPVNS